jgi:hypothetical protein
MVEWEHKGTAAVAEAAASTVVADILDDFPTTAVEDDAAIPHVACRPGGTLVGYPQNHLSKVLT